jgi:hypothetical protein
MNETLLGAILGVVFSVPTSYFFHWLSVRATDQENEELKSYLETTLVGLEVAQAAKVTRNSAGAITDVRIPIATGETKPSIPKAPDNLGLKVSWEDIAPEPGASGHPGPTVSWEDIGPEPGASADPGPIVSRKPGTKIPVFELGPPPHGLSYPRSQASLGGR